MEPLDSAARKDREKDDAREHVHLADVGDRELGNVQNDREEREGSICRAQPMENLRSPAKPCTQPESEHDDGDTGIKASQVVEDRARRREHLLRDAHPTIGKELAAPEKLSLEDIEDHPPAGGRERSPKQERELARGKRGETCAPGARGSAAIERDSEDEQGGRDAGDPDSRGPVKVCFAEREGTRRKRPRAARRAVPCASY